MNVTIYTLKTQFLPKKINVFGLLREYQVIYSGKYWLYITGIKIRVKICYSVVKMQMFRMLNLI
jgi:hypothetical protein